MRASKAQLKRLFSWHDKRAQTIVLCCILTLNDSKFVLYSRRFSNLQLLLRLWLSAVKMRPFVVGLLKIRKRVHLCVAVACFRLLPMKDYLNPSLVSPLTPFAFLCATPLSTLKHTNARQNVAQPKKKAALVKCASPAFHLAAAFYEDVTHNAHTFLPVPSFRKKQPLIFCANITPGTPSNWCATICVAQVRVDVSACFCRHWLMKLKSETRK